jgi:YHS domain-containing protein
MILVWYHLAKEVIDMKTLMLAIVAVLALSGIAYAGCGGCCGGSARGGTTHEAGLINDTCPVMGGPVDKNTPYQTSYRGKKVGFCCAQCVSEFRKDPERYLKKLDTDQSG